MPFMTQVHSKTIGFIGYLDVYHLFRYRKYENQNQKQYIFIHNILHCCTPNQSIIFRANVWICYCIEHIDN